MNAPTPLSGLTPAQMQTRSEGVGASEAAAALGLSERMSMAELWAVKTRRQPPIDDAPVLRLGNAIEPFILDEYQLVTGITQIARKPDTFRRGRQIAHLDALAMADETDGGIAVECKWRGSREGWGEPHSADIPLDTMLQVQQQMALAGLRFAHVPVLFMRPPIVIYAIDFDAELADMIAQGVDRFWWHVERDVAPTVNPDAPHALEALRIIYKGTDGTRIQATRELEQWRGVLQSAAELRGDYEKTADIAKAHLLRAMGPAAELQFMDGTLFRRKLVTRKAYAVEATTYVDARFSKPKE